VYRRLVKLTLEELRLIEDHLGQLDQQMAALLSHHHEAVHRLADVNGRPLGWQVGPGLHRRDRQNEHQRERPRTRLVYESASVNDVTGVW
jgi:hypothetical protein